MQPVKVRSILFTEDCPLNCRYCDLKNGGSYGKKSSSMNFETIKEKIKKYDEEDNPKEITTRLLFTGGEPFLYWNNIKEIILQYGHRFQYSFNTSGYCFSEEILSFLSNYTVSFVLSIDGEEKLTNYLRPVKNTPYHVGYFKQLKKNLSTLLYFFPKTPFRIIINPRYVDLLYSIWEQSNQLGFKYFSLVLDFESRPGRNIPGKTEWNEEASEKLYEQLDNIVKTIISGYKNNIKYTEIIEINNIIEFLLKRETFNTKKLPCQIFNNRTLSTLYHEEESYCMKRFFQNINEAEEELKKAYVKQDHKCIKNAECQAFEYCALHCCPQYSLVQHGEFFNFDDLECVLNKATYTAALKLLYLGNLFYSENTLYNSFINQFDYPEKEVAIYGDILQM